MEGMVEMTNPVEQSVGGIGGHIFRRVIHIAMVLIPVVYYWYADPIAENIIFDKEQIASIVVITLLVVEAGRLKMGITIYGQRKYESEQMSALAWGALGVGISLLMAPEYGVNGAAFGLPLIACLSFGDPFLGELRRFGLSDRNVFIGGTALCAIIWIISWQWLETPWWFAIFLAPITVAAEWPRLRWIDDNATMILIPLIAVILLYPFV
ncbi:MAG: hypothetical protein HOC79_00645 [Euryarchaeota archaeon]|nr:hypothetical protein [Euryarchaeota archaeon]